MDDLANPREPLVQILRIVVHMAVRLLAVLMTLVILWSVADVVMVLYHKLETPPIMMLTISDILALFGAFMAVLIAIARKVIIMDLSKITADYILAVAALTLAMSVGYWLVVLKGSTEDKKDYCNKLEQGEKKT